MTATTSASNAASDASAGSSPVVNSVATEGAPSKPQTTQQRMQDSIAARRAAAASATTGPASPKGNSGKPEGVSPESSPGAADLADGSTDPEGKEKPDEQATPQQRSIPEAAFKARLGQVQSKLTAEREGHASARLELEKAKAAIEILQASEQRYRQMLEEGRAFDPRDEELAARDFGDRAKSRSEELVREHEAALREAEQRVLEESKREQWKEKLSNQLDSALPRYQLASRRTVIEALKANPRLSVEEAAKTVHLKELERLERLGYAPRAAAPAATTERADIGVRSPGSSSSTTGRFPNNAKGMEDYLAAQRAARQR